MSKQQVNQIMLLISVVEYGKASKLMKSLDNMNIRMHIQSLGFGKATTEMMDIFGLGTKDKDILFSFATEEAVKNFAADFADNFARNSQYGGIVFVIKLSAINRIAAEIITRHQQEIKGVDADMKSEHKHNLIMITVNQGYVNEVMQTAKRAGATGGTVIKGRLAEIENFKEIANIEVEEEREIILIMAPADTSATIMEEVNREFGIKTEAKGILCSIPIETAYKI